MNEIRFIQENSERWKETEVLIRNFHMANVDELSRLYILLNDDLSYAQTFFPKSKTTLFLNQLLLRLHQNLYKQKKVNGRFFSRFLFHDLPRVCWHHRAAIYTAFIIFGFFCFLGSFSFFQDKELANLILGDSYVRMTENNIAQGDPLGVYGQDNEDSMFFRLSINNIQVAFFAYFLGLFFCIGTVYILLYNGMMVGVFISWFAAEELFSIAFSTIMLHGTLELSAICLAGAAGLIAGYALLKPGTYSRGLAFRKNMKNSFLLLLSVAIVLLIAAFIEAFVTRHYMSLGPLLRWLIVVSSALLVLFYFFVYPYIYAKKHASPSKKIRLYKND